MKGAHGHGEPIDKYEQLLSKYDWHSPHPPRGYQYGVGRGAKAFVTSGELASGLALSALGKPSREETDFFSALDRLEEKPLPRQLKNKRKHSELEHKRDEENGEGRAVQKITMEDLAALSALGTSKGTPVASVDGPSATAAPEGRAPALAGTVGGFLTTRSARSEAVDKAEEYLFSDERGLTMHDILRGKNSAVQHSLMNILDMGSPDEQGTWITHARALREMGMIRKAQQTLQEGCARAGKRGPMIWMERLAYVSEHDVAARRRILEEATGSCPGEEQLWLQLLSYQLPHERIGVLQAAVIACPHSEELWLRVVGFVHSPREQRRILTQALQRTPSLPLLWAKLARLEPSFDVGKRIFNAAAQRYPSLALVLEAAKYAEWSAYRVDEGRRTGGAEAEGASRDRLTAMHTAIEDMIRAAAKQYLDVSDGGSCRRWMEAAQQVCNYGNLSGEEGSGASTHRYVWTAAYMCFTFLLPPPKGSAPRAAASPTSPAIQPTWLEDLLSTMDSPFSQHGTLCSIWAMWLLLARKQLLVASSSPGEGSGSGHPAASAVTAESVPYQIIDVLRAAVEAAPESALRVAVSGILAMHPLGVVVTKEEASSPVAIKEEPANEEEEEEELARPSDPALRSACAQLPSASTQSASVKGEVTHEDEKAHLVRGDEDCLPLPFSVVLRHTLSPAEGAAGGDGSPLLAPSFSSHLVLALAKAFYARGQFGAALLILQVAHRRRSSTTGDGDNNRDDSDGDSDDDDDVVAATAKCYAALGMHREADECLQAAIDAKMRHRRPSRSPSFSKDLLWVKLAVHRRSGLGCPCDLEEFLAEATSTPCCPHSERLWLMRLEAVRGRIAQSVSSATAAAAADAPRQLISAAQMKELRALYEQSLSLAHCPSSAEIWSYVAVRIEAELFHSAATARARLLDAAIACGTSLGGRDGRSARGSLKALAGGDAPHRAAVTLGVARAKVELLHAGSSQALEVVREVLQKLPKTSEGAFTVPVGELLQLFIDLEVPAARGRAAAQVMRQWKSREPLALLAVAKVYHAAAQFPKALEQALKAATEGGAGVAFSPRSSHVGAKQECHGSCTRSNGWGDCAALLWCMAHRTEYQRAVAQKLGIKQSPEVGEEAPPLSETSIDRWLLQVLTGGGADRPRSAEGEPTRPDDGAHSATKATADAAAGSSGGAKSEMKKEETEEGGEGPPADRPSWDSLHLNRGPLWIQVAKARDPTNVTLLGYRSSVEDMLKQTAALLDL